MKVDEVLNTLSTLYLHNAYRPILEFDHNYSCTPVSLYSPVICPVTVAYLLLLFDRPLGCFHLFLLWSCLLLPQ